VAVLEKPEGKMNKTLIIENEIIINIASGEPQSEPLEGQEYFVVPYEKYVSVGWIRDGGNWIDPNPPVIPEPEPITEIDSRRAKLALYEMGLYTTIQNTIDSMDIPAQINWKDATIWRKDDSLIQSISAGLGLTESDITELFEKAATLS
jgi:hypothetical protein